MGESLQATDAGVLIRSAEWRTDEAIALQLLRNYSAFLSSNPGGSANISVANYEQELVSLPETWSEPDGVLLLAFVASRPAGCVAVRVRHDRPGACEMKRLWVEPEMRGYRLGRRLAQAAIDKTLAAR